jgi:GT2 family glycosyltransferase
MPSAAIDHRSGTTDTLWPQVSIVILNWNGWRETVECLESVRSAAYPHYRVVVVDNGSIDDSVEQLRAWGRRTGDAFVLVEHEDNLGYAGGANAGIRHGLAGPAAAEFVFLLNNDARLDPAALTESVRVSTEEDAAIVGAVIRSLDGAKVLFAGARFPLELFVDRLGTVRHTPEHERRSWPSDRAEASAMLVRRDVIEQRLREVGYVFDPGLFMYFDETDLCQWARGRGHRVLISGGAVAYHRPGGAAGGPGNPVMQYYMTRNRVLLARRWLHGPQRLAFHLCFFPYRMARAAERLLRGKPSVAGAILHGVLDGYRSVTGRWVRHPRGRG